jgi:hypothetical protein
MLRYRRQVGKASPAIPPIRRRERCGWWRETCGHNPNDSGPPQAARDNLALACSDPRWNAGRTDVGTLGLCLYRRPFVQRDAICRSRCARYRLVSAERFQAAEILLCGRQAGRGGSIIQIASSGSSRCRFPTITARRAGVHAAWAAAFGGSAAIRARHYRRSTEFVARLSPCRTGIPEPILAGSAEGAGIVVLIEVATSSDFGGPTRRA